MNNSSGTLDKVNLSFAAEIAGDILDGTKVIPILLKLLTHESPMVREGVLYGLSKHMRDDLMINFRIVSETDPHPLIREIALEILESFYE